MSSDLELQCVEDLAAERALTAKLSNELANLGKALETSDKLLTELNVENAKYKRQLDNLFLAFEAMKREKHLFQAAAETLSDYKTNSTEIFEALRVLFEIPRDVGLMDFMIKLNDEFPKPGVAVHIARQGSSPPLIDLRVRPKSDLEDP